MNKYICNFLIIIALSMICACERNEADDVQAGNADRVDPVEEAGTDAPAEDAAEISNAEEDETELNTAAGAESAVLPEDVYEAYLAVNADKGYLYAYFDYDNDGKQELYLRDNAKGWVMKYAYGGLIELDRGDISEKNLNGLAWKEIERDGLAGAADPEETVHEGVYAFIDQNPYGEQNIWYVDEKAFLSQYGFGESAPLYEYVFTDGSVRLALYYDEANGIGCGLRYYQRDPSLSATSQTYGFSFMGVAEKTDSWTYRLNVDYTKFESWDGYTVSSWPSCEENIVYDDAGRVALYEASALIDTEDEEPSLVLVMEYEYDDSGILRQRRYYHNQLALSTTYTYWYSYFDELGRLEHEDFYHTHGSMEYYYIYPGESVEPVFGLFLDNNCGLWIPKFVQF